MNKKLKTIVIVLLMLVVIGPVTYADLLPINIYINDAYVDFYDVKPFIDENSRTLVPVRFLSENFGGNVQWLPETRKVNILKDDIKIILEIDSKFANVNGEIIEMDTKALIVEGRTLVPLRFVSEAFDFEINYERKNDLNNQMSHVINIYNIHLKIASELKAFNESKFDLKNYEMTVDDTSNLNEELIDYYPELYFMNGFYYDYIDQEVVSLQLKYIEGVEILEEKYSKLMMQANLIIDSIINDDMSEYEKEEAIHDYLVENIRYDENNEWPVESHTAYGALVNGVAVCDGYAESFDLLLKMVGIKSKLIYGKLDGQSHAWNLVEINGTKYFVDVTADDPTNNNENYMKYTFFNIPYEWMINSHDFNENYEFVDAIEDNYFYKNNLYFNSIDVVNDYIYNELAEKPEEIRLNFMLGKESLKEQIDLEEILQRFLSTHSKEYNQSYSYIEMDKDSRYVYDIIIKLDRR